VTPLGPESFVGAELAETPLEVVTEAAAEITAAVRAERARGLDADRTLWCVELALLRGGTERWLAGAPTAGLWLAYWRHLAGVREFDQVVDAQVFDGLR
jgi:hypothetical protein